MKTYTIKAPNGKTYSIDGPEGATQDEVISQILKLDPNAGNHPDTVDQKPVSEPVPITNQSTVTPQAPFQRGVHDVSYEGDAPLSSDIPDNQAVISPEEDKQRNEIASLVQEAGKTKKGDPLAIATAIKNKFPILASANPSNIAWYINHYRQGGKSPIQWTQHQQDNPITVTGKPETAPDPVATDFATGLPKSTPQKIEDDLTTGFYEGLGKVVEGATQWAGASPPDQRELNARGDLYHDPQSYSRSAGNIAGESAPFILFPEASPEASIGSKVIRYAAEGGGLGAVESGGGDNAGQDILSGALGAAAAGPILEGIASKVLGPKGEIPVKQDVLAPETPADVNPADEVISRLTDALNTAGKARQSQSELYTQERAARLKNVAAARQSMSGEARHNAELAALKGPMERADFEGVSNQFTQQDIDLLFDHIKQEAGKTKSLYDGINADSGLRKVLQGQIPTNTELDALGTMFPKDFIKATMRNRTSAQKVLDFGLDALNMPRSLMSSGDLSAPFRQGVWLSGTKEFRQAYKEMFKYAWDEKNFNALYDNIKTRDTFPLMEEAGLHINDGRGSVDAMEERFKSHLAEKLPGLGKLTQMSERGYVGFLNKLRADTFDSLLSKAKDAGYDYTNDPQALEKIAKFVNNATGRGNIKGLDQTLTGLNGIFFSPRLMASRIQMLNPYTYYQLPVGVRKEAVKSVIKSGALLSAIGGAAIAGGATVSFDPKSSDFLKPKFGNTRYDLQGGEQQYLVLASRLYTNQKTNSKGIEKDLGTGKFGSETRADIAGQFIRNKLAPVPSFVWDYFDGKDSVGNPFYVGLPNVGEDLKQGNIKQAVDTVRDNAIAKRSVSMFWNDYLDIVEEQGAVKGTAMSMPGMFGVGTQTYDSSSGHTRTYKVTDPQDGKTYSIDGPKGKSTEEVLQAIRSMKEQQ